MNQAGRIILQIGAVVTFSMILGLMVNGIRLERLPLVMPFPPQYQCPSRIPEGLAIGVGDALTRYKHKQILFVDARSREAFEKGRIEGAINLPYSFLDPVPAEAAARLSKSGNLVVYCNSNHAKRSKLMAGELSDAGLGGVSYLEGGFLEWVKAGGAYTGQKPEEYE
jgi:rhodanese-related sulfurtransferase